MNADQIRSWLSLLGAQQIKVGPGWVNCSCPLAPYRHQSGKDSHPSFGIQISTVESHCFCLACHFHGKQMDLIYELVRCGAPISKHEAMQLIVASTEEIPILVVPPDYEELNKPIVLVEYPESMREKFEPAYYQGQVHPYLLERSVTYSCAKHLDLRFDPARRRIVFPVRDYGGVLRGLHGRLIVPGNLPYLGYPSPSGATNMRHTWLGEHLVRKDLPVVIVESVFDYTATWRVWENLLSPLRSSISKEQLSRISWIQSAVIFMDLDEAGERARVKLQKFFSKKKISYADAYVPSGLVDEQGKPVKDPGNLSERMIFDILLPFLESEQ